MHNNESLSCGPIVATNSLLQAEQLEKFKADKIK